MKSLEQLEQDFNVMSGVLGVTTAKLNKLENLKMGPTGPVGPMGMQGEPGRDLSEELQSLLENVRFMFKFTEVMVYGNLNKSEYVNLMKLLDSDDQETVNMGKAIVEESSKKIHTL